MKCSFQEIRDGIVNGTTTDYNTKSLNVVDENHLCGDEQLLTLDQTLFEGISKSSSYLLLIAVVSCITMPTPFSYQTNQIALPNSNTLLQMRDYGSLK